MLTFELLYSHVSRSHRPDCHTCLFLTQNVQPISLLMYHVSQMDTAFDDFFCRLKLISRLGLSRKSNQPLQPGLFKRFLCRQVYPICKWKSPPLSFFYCQGEIEFSKITVVCSAPILFWLQIEDYFLFATDFLSLDIFVVGRLFPVPVSVGKSFL